MPLIRSDSKDAISKNIKTEMSHGKSHKQSVAIALATADVVRKMKQKKKK
jgi:hypothetical protein